jgi:integrase/recombinase XerD
MKLARATDQFIGELARRGYSKRTLDDYWRKLDGLCDLTPEAEVSEITAEDCRAYLDRWRSASPGTIAHSVSVLNSFFGWLYDERVIERNPMERIKRPRKPAPEDLDVKTVSPDDVRRLLNACETWHELLCVSTLAYLGCRRRAASRLRLRDLDLDRETVRLFEKGGKVAVKPLPGEYLALVRAAVAAGAIENKADAYVIPMMRKQLRDGERDDRVIWRTVTRIGKRTAIDLYPHSLRAAFAVNFLESHPGELEALQALMGHTKIETTQVYLRRLDRERAMERVKDLSWGVTRFEALPVKAPSRFELLYEALQASA